MKQIPLLMRGILMKCFKIDKWTEGVLSIPSSQMWSNLLASISKMRKTGKGEMKALRVGRVPLILSISY